MEPTTLARIDLALVDEPEGALRDHMDADALGALVDDIAVNGLLQPAGVRGPSPAGRFMIVWGHRRLLAMRALKWASADFKVFPWSFDPIDAMASENLQRADLNPVEEAKLVKRLHEAGRPLVAIARTLRRGPQWVRDRLDLLTYPDDIRAAVLDKSIGLGAAAELAAVDHEDYRRSLIAEASRTGANQVTVGVWVAHYRADRERIIRNEHTVEEIIARREEWAIYTPCQSCRVSVDFKTTRSYRFCATCADAVDAAIRGEAATGDAGSIAQLGQAPPRS